MNKPVLACRRLCKSFYDGERKQTVLDRIDFSVAAGEAVSIIGASGSGKTTLLHLLGGLDAPDSGQVVVGERDLTALSDIQRADWRNRHLGFIFQFHLLLPEFSAEENVAMPLLLRRVPYAQAVAAAQDCLRAVGMIPHAKKTPEKLSGGERQRTAVARALAGSPRCILADEPTGNLDRKNAEAVFELLFSTSRERGVALVFVSHDERLATRADRCLTLTDGILSGSADLD